MWTPTTRRQHSREGLRYETDITDAEWAVIEPLLPPPSRRGRPPKWTKRELLDAILYMLRGGIAESVPKDLPPDVIALVAESLLNKHAERLGVRETTVKAHVGQAIKRLGFGNPVQLAVLTCEAGDGCGKQRRRPRAQFRMILHLCSERPRCCLSLKLAAHQRSIRPIKPEHAPSLLVKHIGEPFGRRRRTLR